MSYRVSLFLNCFDGRNPVSISSPYIPTKLCSYFRATWHYGRQKRNNSRRRGDVRAYGAHERRRPLGRRLKKTGESRPVNCGPRDRGVRRDRGATWWNNAIGALRGGMPVRRAHLFTICLVRESWTTRSDKRLTIGTQPRWNRSLKSIARVTWSQRKVLPFRILARPASNGTENFHALNFQLAADPKLAVVFVTCVLHGPLIGIVYKNR